MQIAVTTSPLYVYFTHFMQRRHKKLEITRYVTQFRSTALNSFLHTESQYQKYLCTRSDELPLNEVVYIKRQAHYTQFDV
jgi:hypothetical protein